MSALPAAKRRIYRFYLPLTLVLSFINFWRLGFYGGRHASKHALIGLYTGFPGRNGDHMYYTSMAMQFAGKSLSQSRTQVAATFKDYPASSIDLVRGYLDPGFAPLIYPRQVLTQLMSWGYRIFGSSGLGFSTLLIGATTIALLIRWVWREWGVGAAWLTLGLIMGSSMFIWYSTGLFIESPLLLIEVIWLYSLPISRNFAHHRYWYYVNVLLIVLMGFTRQSPLLPIAVLTGGWFAQFLQRKKIRNSWFGITLLGGATAIATYFVTNVWAPYSPIGLSNTRHPSLSAGAKYLWNFLATDPVICLTLVLAIFAARKIKDKTLVWVGLGVFVSCAINVYLATGEYRYWSPLFIFIAPLAGYQLARLIKAGHEIDAPTIKPAKPYLALYLTLIISVMIALSSLLFYGKADGAIRATVPVSQIYPTSKVSGSIGCYGPSLRIYLIQNGKKVAALDGTAMAANPGITNTLGGPDHGLTYGPLARFITQCMAVSGS